VNVILPKFGITIKGANIDLYLEQLCR